MSISKVRGLFEKKGCQVMAYILGFLTIVGLLYTGTCRGMVPGSGGNGASTDPVVMVVGQQKINVSQVELAEKNFQNDPTAAAGDPQVDFLNAVRAIDQIATEAAISNLAKKNGVVVTDAAVTALLVKQKPEFIARQRQDLITAGKIKADASEADFVKAFKEKNGTTPDEAHKAFIDNILSKMKDPTSGSTLKVQVEGALLNDLYQTKSTVTIEKLKDSYTSYKVKRLMFTDPKMDVEQKKAEAAKALVDLKNGVKFDDAIKKYDKSGSNVVMPLDKKRVETSDQLKFLLDLKPGQFSDVREENGTVIIYQLVDVKQELPPDFEKNKETLLKNFKVTEANDKLESEIKAYKEGGNIQFKDDGFKLAYDLYQLQANGFSQGLDKMSAQLKEIATKAKSIQPQTVLGSKLKTLVRYMAFESYFMGLKPDEQKAEREERTEILREVLEDTPSMRLRMDLFDNLVAAEDYESAGETLVDAAKNDVGSDPASVAANNELEARIAQAEKNAKIPKESIEAAKKEVERWKRERAEDEKQREADEKEMKESSKAADKDLEKLNDPDAVKKNATAGGPGPSKK